MDFLQQIEYESLLIIFLRILFISICTFRLNYKILNNLITNKKIFFKVIIYNIVISFIYCIIQKNTNFLMASCFLITVITILFSKFSKEDIEISLITTVISLVINYILLLIAIAICFYPNYVLKIKNNIVGFATIVTVYLCLVIIFLKIKKIQKGFSFLTNKKNEYNVLVLNISSIILFSIIIFESSTNSSMADIGTIIIILSILSAISIYKSIQAYYRQKLLIQDLNETKRELEEKKKEVTELENENLKISMRSHSIAHKQKSLEYKLNKLLQSSETADEIDLKDRMETVAKEAYAIPFAIKLMKTEVAPIDDMIEFMQAECIKNSIEFDLIINGNIHKMVNNYIEKEDLEVLLADHIKDAIIAINHTDNINRSILVKLGEFDNYYSLNIYDSGVNFPKEIIENLGKMPVTSYLGEGGTGMGYMNTFNLLNKYKASLTIEEFGRPSKENYTKVISIIFDNKNEFKIL